MKRTTTTTKAQAARTAVLTRKDLARVIGGTGGTIIVENVIKVPQGIQGTGVVVQLQGIQGSG
jgi:hypothetical protein